ncbi:transcriptional regulator FtsR [Tomitella biformata]|uniref:transcriptional regulator FtsR n=1 Tax=Tomitella biformata TaxID=630403 RepID=UPI000463E7DC
MTAASQPAPVGMSIGTVLDRLRPEFPDVTISKIRFLEAEGLVTPERTPSGYRRFSVGDCERLKYVLTAQRDQYLPLKVIKEQLEAGDSGAVEVVPLRHPRALAIAPGLVSPEAFRSDPDARMSRGDLCARAEVEDRFVTELIRAGLLTPGAGGFFNEDSVTLVKTVRDMAGFGLEVRHLRAFKSAADREAGLVAQIAAPVAKGREAGARDRAEELVRELAALSVTLHSCLVKAAVRNALDG